MTNPFLFTIFLMVVLAPIGGIDVFYYHLWKFRLYKQPSAQGETVTHIIRALLFSSGLFLISFYEPRGWFYWGVGFIFLADLANNMADVFLEPGSRKPLGGIPRLEYMIHILGATGSGAITISYFILGWELRLLPTDLAPAAGSLLFHFFETSFSLNLKTPALFNIIGAFLMALFELGLLLNYRRKIFKPAKSYIEHAS